MQQLLIYPMMTVSDSIVWQAIDNRGREHWCSMLDVGTDPITVASRRLTNCSLIKCSATDNRVLAALKQVPV